jgi:hypothetical protein
MEWKLLLPPTVSRFSSRLATVVTEEICSREAYLRSLEGVSKLLLIGLSLLVATLFVQGAKADTIDFGCGGSQACTGVVAQNGSNYNTTTPIGVTSSLEGDLFMLNFDTGANTIWLSEGGTTEFMGTITNFSATTNGGVTTVDLGVVWTINAPDSSDNQGVTPFPSGSVVSITMSGNALSVDVPILAPEPAAPVLLSTGLVALGLLLKRRCALLA